MTTITPKSLLNIVKIYLRGDRNPLLNEILTVVGREMRAHSGTIMLVNEETGELEMVATFGLPDDYIENARLYTRIENKNVELEYEINERKRAEAALREKKELLSNILAGSAAGIGVVEDRKLSWTNESMMKMFGVENEEDYIGQSAKILYASEEEYERVGQILHKNRTDKVVQFDAQLKRKDGSIVSSSN